MGRRLLQITNPIATCGLTQLVVQAQAAGVSVEAIATLFLEILLVGEPKLPLPLLALLVLLALMSCLPCIIQTDKMYQASLLQPANRKF